MSDIVERLTLLESGARWQDTEAADLIEEAAAEIERLRAALRLAANRLDRLSVELPAGSERRYEACEWVDEARAALAEDGA